MDHTAIFGKHYIVSGRVITAVKGSWCSSCIFDAGGPDCRKAPDCTMNNIVFVDGALSEGELTAMRVAWTLTK
jgi:hypothetical protein